jgi:hypothetical protein
MLPNDSVVFITSNYIGNTEIMEGCKESGIPAFGTLWDFVSFDPLRSNVSILTTELVRELFVFVVVTHICCGGGEFRRLSHFSP